MDIHVCLNISSIFCARHFHSTDIFMTSVKLRYWDIIVKRIFPNLIWQPDPFLHLQNNDCILNKM